MDIRILMIILGMAAVTYIPRAVPALFIDKISMSPFVERFLRLIPYTAMAALIFPGVLGTDGENVWVGIIGALTAAVLGWKKLPSMVCVLGAVAADMLFYMLMTGL